MRRSIVNIMVILTVLLSLSAPAALTHRYSFADNPNPADPNVVDSVGGQNGTLMGGATIATLANGQVTFDGVDDYVNLPGPAINIPSYSAVTIEQWITSATTNSGFTMTFVTGNTGNPGTQYLDMQPTRNGATTDGCRFTISNSDWSAEVASVYTQMNDGIQHHLVGVVEGTTITLYVDGVAMPSMALTTQSLAALSSATAYLGKSVYTGDAYFAGSINETRIYNSALSAPAVVLNYQLGPDKVQTCALASMSPVNNATNIPISSVLSWTPDASITVGHYEVFFKTDPNLLDPNKVPVPAGTPDYSGANVTYTKGGLSYDTNYYWRVDTVASDTTRYVGPRYKFRTLPPTPTFTVNPGTSVAIPGGSVSLTATVSTAFPLTKTIQWFKEAGTTDVEITTADPDVTIVEIPAGSLTTSTLTINNVAIARNGEYYAKATNTGGFKDSANGWIVVKGLIARYQFESNLNDSSGSGLNGSAKTPSGAASTVAYVASINTGMGQALSLTGTGTSNITNTTDPYVDLPDGFGNFTQGLTITAWVYPTATVAWQRICQFGNGTNGASNSFYFTRNGSTTQIRFENDNTTAPTSALLITGANNTITTGAWQFFAITLNTNATNNAAIYRNGVRVAYGTIALPYPVTRTNCFIGRSEWYGDNLFRGQMDDFRVYNYALTRETIGQMYNDVTGNTAPICQYYPTYDYNQNCIIDLPDLATFATQWLQCGIYPSTGNCN